MVKALVDAGKVRTTHAARTAANELELALSDMLDVAMTLTPADFCKSMTTHADRTAPWRSRINRFRQTVESSTDLRSCHNRRCISGLFHRSPPRGIFLKDQLAARGL